MKMLQLLINNDYCIFLIMRTIKFLFVLILVFACGSKKDKVLNLNDSYWISESINEENVKEYIFIDKQGFFTRASWDRKDYIIDMGTFNGLDDVFGNQAYKLSLIDSVSLKVISKCYTGIFKKRGKFSSDKLKRFYEGDSIKKVIHGSWVLQEINYEPLIKDKFPYLEEKQDLSKLSLDFNLHIDSEVFFNNTNRVLFENSDGHELLCKYKINDNKVKIRINDLIISLPIIKLNDDQLVIEIKNGLWLGEFNFVRNS